MRANKNIKFITLLLVLILISSCGSHRKLADSGASNDRGRIECDSISELKSLYISKIESVLKIDGDTYDAKISLYYIPDSIIYISAVNAGFEIIRIGVLADSAIIINRLEKIVFITRESELGYENPLSFNDLELLINRKKLCLNCLNLGKTENDTVLDYSSQNLKRYIGYDQSTMTPNHFEFFHKKTGEYVVGDIARNRLRIYSNYIIDNLEILVSGGEIVEKDININLRVNPNKYTLIEL